MGNILKTNVPSGSQTACSRILHVIDCLEIGGAERVVVQSANLFSIQGHQVGVAVITNPGPLSQELNKTVRLLVLRREVKWNPFKLWRLRQWMTQYGIIHVHMRHVLKYVVLAKILFPFRQKIVFHDHFGKIRIDKSVTPMLKLCLSFVIYMGVSKELCSWASTTAGLKKKYVHYLPNPAFKMQRTRRPKKATASNRLVMVANFRPEKNIEFALHLIHACLPTQQFTLEVFGQTVDKAYCAALHALIIELDLKNKVLFFHGHSSVELSCSKYLLGLHTARSETGPLVLMEYMSAGLPFLAYNTGEVAARVRNRLPQMILNNFNLEHWKSRLLDFCLEDRQEASLALWKMSETLFSQEKYYQRLCAIYQSIV